MKKTFFLFVFLYAVSIFAEKPFERFVGLGNCCVCRFQINHHLGTRFQRDPKTFGGGQLFDWLVIHDYDKLVQAIENNLEDILERKDLAVLPCWDANYVRNMKYLMTWNHLFTLPVTDLVLEKEYELKKEKIDYLVGKFKQLNQYRTLYIIAYPYEGTGPLNTLEPDLKTLIRLRNALKQFRGDDNFVILFCPLEKKFGDYENILVRTIINGPGVTAHVGNFEHWHPMLNEFPFSAEHMSSDKNTWAEHMNW